MAGFSRFTPLTQSLPATVPFVGPETQERRRGGAFAARIGANESCFGPSPAVIEAMRDVAPDVWKYPDPECHDLIAAVARRLGLKPENVVIGEGIDGLLGLTVRMVAEPQTPIVNSLGAYPTFNYHVAGFGARLVTVPYVSDCEDLGSLLAAVRREDAPLVYLANPDNPMGSWWEAGEIETFARALPETTLLVLDEAYGETAPAGALPFDDALTDMPNVVRMRTFSKAYGLAGIRVAYAFGHPGTIVAYNKVRNHFGVGRLAQAAALAAIGDGAWLTDVVRRIARGRERIAAIAQASGLEPLPSATNFVAVDCGRDGAFAGRVLEKLVARGIFIRMPGVAPLNRCIRISVGLDHELDLFAEALPQALRDAET